MKEPLKTAKTITDMVSELGIVRRELETFVEADVLPKAERDYQIAKATKVAELKADGKTIGEIELSIKGLIADKLYERDSAQIKYKSLIVRLDVRSKQLNGFQSANRFIDAGEL